jgi:hypothetical protein
MKSLITFNVQLSTLNFQSAAWLNVERWTLNVECFGCGFAAVSPVLLNCHLLQ